MELIELEFLDYLDSLGCLERLGDLEYRQYLNEMQAEYLAELIEVEVVEFEPCEFGGDAYRGRG